MEEANNVILVGGGLPSLFAALVYSEKYPHLNIAIVEKTGKLGGTYGSLRHDEAGVFDHGMHLVYTTTNKLIDKYIFECFDKEEWNILEGNSKDIAGVYYNGYLNTQSPYLDLNFLDYSHRELLFSSLFEAINNKVKNPSQCQNAFEYYESIFGKSFTEKIIDPILKKLWGHESTKLSPYASKLVLMDRINYFSHSSMLDLSKSELIRKRFGFPDQMKLPNELKNSQVGLYPKKFGMDGLISRIRDILISRGVKIHLNSEITEFKVQKNMIRSVVLEKNNKTFAIDKINRVTWTIPIFLLKTLLKTGQTQILKMDPPRKQQNVYLLLKKPPQMGDLYYFFCLENNFKTFRVTNYFNYCPNALRPVGGKYPSSYPICVELHFSNTENIKPGELLEQTIAELLQFGVINSKKDIVFSMEGNHAAGFPVLTNTNIESQSILKKSVEEARPYNLTISGQEPDKGIFFFHEIIEKMYKTIVE